MTTGRINLKSSVFLRRVLLVNVLCFAKSYKSGTKSLSVIRHRDLLRGLISTTLRSDPSIGSPNDAALVHWTGNPGRHWPHAFQLTGRPPRRPLGRSRKLPRHL